MIEYNDGIHLRGTDIWFDSKRKARFSFISNASFSEFSSHEKIIATPQTIRLLQNKIKKSVVLPCPFNHPFTLGKTQVELIPSGYVPGSSQIVVDLGERRILYTGDFKLGKSKTAEPVELRRCDTLIMKCTYGVPKYTFPPSRDVIGSIVEFVDDSIYSGFTPVLLVNALGEAQEVAKVLGDSGFRLSLHKTIYKLLKVYEEFGVVFTNYESFRPERLEGKILLVPPHLRGADSVEEIERKRVAAVTGWALDGEPVKSMFGADEAFPLSSSAGYDEMIQFVEIVKPKDVYLIHGFAPEFANTLQKRGIRAKPLETPSQLKLL